jgi:hypothetical protein
LHGQVYGNCMNIWWVKNIMIAIQKMILGGW